MTAAVPMSRAETEIRPATIHDLDALARLFLALQDHLEASTPDLWRMTDEGRGQVRAQLRARLEASGSRVLVADDPRDGVVGMAFARIVVNNRYRPARTGIVDQVFVGPEHRRQGVGRRLVAGLWRFFQADGVDDISLRYGAGNREAESFWSALGFTPRVVTAGVHLDKLTDRWVQPKRLDPSEQTEEPCPH